MSARRSVAWAAVVGLTLMALTLRPKGTQRATTRSLGARLLGPAAELVADFHWYRFHKARLRGEVETAFVHADRALALAPRQARGWRLFSSHLGLFLAGPVREPDAERRRIWLRMALEVTRRGERDSDDPAALAFQRGLLLLTHAEGDPELGWPGGTRALFAQAAQALERSVALGYGPARALAALARERAGG